MNRAHAYKAARDRNMEAGEDLDAGINMGLFDYPVLMAADILIMAVRRRAGGAGPAAARRDTPPTSPGSFNHPTARASAAHPRGGRAAGDDGPTRCPGSTAAR